MKMNRKKVNCNRRSVEELRSARITFRQSLIAAAISTTLASQASANPQGPSVVAGAANISSTASGQMLISNTPGAIINWQGFSISRDEITRFVQQNAGSAVLNRVIGNQRSDIFGKLLSNGRVFLVNPNGIVFGEHAIIDTAGLIASSLDISDADFIAGKMHFEGDRGEVRNHGYIRVNNAGEVMLIAPDVTNTGIIRADDGQILLAAGRSITISNLDLEHIEFEVQAPGDKVLNLGSIVAKNGTIALFADTLVHGGSISANRISRDKDGRVRLHGTSTVDINGSISSRGRTVAGGDIAITGDNIKLTATRIDASGKDGGRVRIGGDYQGVGDLPRSSRTNLDATTQIHADALTRGDGGEVVVWSDGDTQTHAQITATGGSVSGDGGLVETSGKQTLAFGQPADVSATDGKPGTWLLDPEDIVIGGGEADSISSALNNGSNVSIKTSDGGSGEGNITVAAAIEKTEGDDASLKLEAHNNIDVNAPISSTSGELNVTLNAGDAVHVNASISTNGGSFKQVITELDIEIPTSNESDDAPDDSQSERELVAVEPEAISEPDDSSAEPDTDAESAEDTELAAIEDAILSQPVVDPIIEPEVNINVLGEQPDDGVFKESMNVLVDADIITNGGDVFVDAGALGDVAIFESIDSSSDNGEGGHVTVLGQRVGLFEDAEIDASGSTGGGEVLFGGDQQGENPDVRNSEDVFISSGASIHADATDNGDGGRVIVFAEGSANILGQLSARGGENGGDGGFIETSGKRYIRVTEAPDAGASAGEGGTWLIDPYNLTVRDEVEGDAEDATYSGEEPITSPITWSGAGDDTESYLYTGTLIGSFKYVDHVIIDVDAAGDTELGNLTFESNINVGKYSYLDGKTLTLQADGDITVTGGLYGSSIYETYRALGDISIIADNDKNGIGAVTILGQDRQTRIDTRHTLNISGASVAILGGDQEGEYVSISTDTLTIDAIDSGPSGANDIVIAGGSGGNASVYITTSTTSVFGNDFTLQGGSAGDGGAYAQLIAYGYETFDAQIDGDLKVLGGTNGDGNFANLTAYNIILGASSVDGAVPMVVLNDLLVQGGASGSNNYASIYSYRGFDAQLSGDVNVLGGGGRDNSASFDSNKDLTLTAAGDFIVKGGSAEDTFARVQSRTGMDIEAKSILVEGGSGYGAFAQLKTRNTLAYGAGYVFSQKITATDGSISVIGGSGERAFAEIGLDLNFYNGSDYSSSNVIQEGYQELSASSDITVMGGSNDGATAAVVLQQTLNEKGPSTGDDVGTVTRTTRLLGNQSLTSGGGINVLGGSHSGGHASVDFTQGVGLENADNVDVWNLDLDGMQRINVTDNIYINSYASTAQIDAEQLAFAYEDGPLLLTSTLNLTRTNKQYVNADVLNITATNGDAGIFTGGASYGGDQSIAVNEVNLISTTTSGARAEIFLRDPNTEHDFSLNADDLNMTQANGGITSINNQGTVSNLILDDLTGTGEITGNFDITVNNLLSPGNSPGTLNLPTLTLGTSATTLLEIESPSNLDQINVAGAAFLDGDLDIVLLSGFVPSALEAFNFINAGGGVSGGFNVTNGDFAGTSLSNDYRVTYTGTPATLPTTTPTGPTAVVATTPLDVPGAEPGLPTGGDPFSPGAIDPLQPILVMLDNPDGLEEEDLPSPVAIGLCTASNS